MRHTILILFTGLLLTLTVSCDNWLDVRPQTEVKVDDNFKTAQGFKDALTGIYLLMSDQGYLWPRTFLWYGGCAWKTIHHAFLCIGTVL